MGTQEAHRSMERTFGRSFLVLIIVGIAVISVSLVLFIDSQFEQDFQIHRLRNEESHSGELCVDLLEEWETITAILPRDEIARAINHCPKIMQLIPELREFYDPTVPTVPHDDE